MTSYFGASIFWGAVIEAPIILMLATLIGRQYGWMLPVRLRANGVFYLAPVLGLATLIIAASLVGRYLPLGYGFVVPAVTFIFAGMSLAMERHRGDAFIHAGVVSIFGIVCGVSVLAPLFVYGAFNSDNDAFTYMAHSSWLQGHAFDEIIPAEEVTPASSQVALYQRVGLRMGSSFLLAFFQALFSARWPYEVFPSLMVASLGACGLAVGFPIAASLRRLKRRYMRLAILALPAFSLGGMVAGANFGFLPQVVGLAMGAGFLFLLGPLLNWVLRWQGHRQAIALASIPCALMFVASAYAYSELLPFLAVAALASGFILILRFGAWEKIFLFGFVFACTSVLLLNSELTRIYTAIKIQSGAVVGMSVDWSLLGFVAHAVGLHGGPWDHLQWAKEGYPIGLAAMGVQLLFAVVIAGVSLNFRLLAQLFLNGMLMPVVIILLIFICGALYFRYAVPSPFPTPGVGQSWNQFKLSEWANPFLMPLLIMAFIGLRKHFGTSFAPLVSVAFFFGLFCTIWVGVMKIAPLMQTYGVGDLNHFYTNFRGAVLKACGQDARIYLALRGPYLKFRQMAAIYLNEQVPHSDWTDDVYIINNLPGLRRAENIAAGDCIVEPSAIGGWLSSGESIGPFRVGIFDGQRGKINIVSVDGAYNRESDGSNWWHWVEHKVDFKLEPSFIPPDFLKTKVQFEYQEIGGQKLALHLIRRNGASQEIILPTSGNAMVSFERVIDVPPGDLSEMSAEGDGRSFVLGKGDPRMAAFMIRNVVVAPAW